METFIYGLVMVIGLFVLLPILRFVWGLIQMKRVHAKIEQDPVPHGEKFLTMELYLKMDKKAETIPDNARSEIVTDTYNWVLLIHNDERFAHSRGTGLIADYLHYLERGAIQISHIMQGSCSEADKKMIQVLMKHGADVPTVCREVAGEEEQG